MCGFEFKLTEPHLQNEDKTFQKIKTKTIFFLESFTKGVYSKKEENNPERKVCDT